MNFTSYKKNTKARRLTFSVGASGGTQIALSSLIRGLNILYSLRLHFYNYTDLI